MASGNFCFFFRLYSGVTHSQPSILYITHTLRQIVVSHLLFDDVDSCPEEQEKGQE